jgi:hypothetical protein
MKLSEIALPSLDSRAPTDKQVRQRELFIAKGRIASMNTTVAQLLQSKHLASSVKYNLEVVADYIKEALNMLETRKEEKS